MQTPHILIVEDELVTRNTLKSIFEAEGYIVLEANNGDEMHQALTSHTINLVIMDINLPGKNGLLLARGCSADSRASPLRAARSGAGLRPSASAPGGRVEPASSAKPPLLHPPSPPDTKNAPFGALFVSR